MATIKSLNVSGKSLLFNILAIVINLTGLIFLTIGYHDSFADSSTLYQVLGYSLFIIGLIALIIFQGWILFAYIGRIIVGGLFIVSGLIKANDPKGFAYKLEEYFEDGALAYRIKDLFGWETFSLEFLIEYALAISVIICILEILLGAMVLLGSKIKLASWLMLLMMLFFTFLTWHTKECDPNSTFKDVDTYQIDDPQARIKIPQAENNPDITILNRTETTVTIEEIKQPQCVDDCGCFGDALKGSVGRSLTPQESFWKDLILLYLVIIIFISRRRFKLNNARENIVLLFFGLLVVLFFSLIFSWSFPMIFAVVSLLLALWIKRTGGKILGNAWGMILMIAVLCGLFVTYVLMYRPLKDYRPYAVGNDLEELMNDGEDGVYQNVVTYENKNTGQDTTLTELNEATKPIWGDTENWKFVERTTKTIKESVPPTIQQFEPTLYLDNMTRVEKKHPYIQKQLKENKKKYVDVIDKNTGDRYPQLLDEFYVEDWDTSQYRIGDTLLRLDESFEEISMLDYILNQDQIILIVSKDLQEGNFSRISRLKEIAENARKNGIDIFIISTVDKEKVKEFREEHGLEVPTLINDATEIKAMTRSNPTLFVMKNGVIKGKYAFRATPSWEWLTTNVLEIQ